MNNHFMLRMESKGTSPIERVPPILRGRVLSGYPFPSPRTSTAGGIGACLPPPHMCAQPDCVGALSLPPIEGGRGCRTGSFGRTSSALVPALLSCAVHCA